MRKKVSFIFLFLCFSINIFSHLSMGEWRMHSSYENVTEVFSVENMIYAISDGALFSIDTNSEEIQTYSKIESLSGKNVSQIAYSASERKLIIAYQDGGFDLLDRRGNVVTINGLKDKVFQADKTPLSIAINNHLAYVSSGIGIVVVDLKKEEIKDTYILGKNNSFTTVYKVIFQNECLYALVNRSDENVGLMKANVGNSLLIDEANWEKIQFSDLEANPIKDMILVENKILILRQSGELFQSDIDSMTSWYSVFPSNRYVSLFADGKNDFFAIQTAPNSALCKYFVQDNNISLSHQIDNVLATKIAVHQSNGKETYFLATQNDGVIKISDNGEVLNQYKPNGPNTNKLVRLFKSTNDNSSRIFAITNSRWFSGDDTPENNNGAICIYENGEWKNIYQKEIAKKVEKHDEHVYPYFMGLTHVAIDPTDDRHFFVSSHYDGLYEFKNDEYHNRFYSYNSTLNFHADNNKKYDSYQITNSVCYDQDGQTLWMTNDDADEGTLHTRDANNRWTQLNHSIIANKLGFIHMMVDKNNNKWILNFRGEGISVLQDNKNPYSTSGHKIRQHKTLYDQDGNQINVSSARCIVEDLDGKIWIGTNNGIIVAENAESLLNGNVVSRPKIARNDGTNYADYLLDSKSIVDIDVDAGNRKWIATANDGLFLVSPDGLETIEYFTEENSFLLSNNLLGVKIIPTTGELLIATANGMMSYQTDAVKTENNLKEINAYPNPVLPSHHGKISITGLMNNSLVKITDAGGKIIYQTRSNGSIATWDGKNLNGEAVSAGVYFVMASVKENDKIYSGVGKIIIVK
ncbi:MAG: T9SS type A sorting domain-containing protein [Paludibacteraceae bacterium]|nr:T9SS type A sorting domain-containing protein [Paludibacteraceae bacterium]